MVKESSTARDRDNRDGNIKKKRKTAASADSEAEMDVYKKVVDFEEKEALSRSADVDAAIYFDITKGIREKLAEIAKLKSKSSGSGDNAQRISELTRECCVQIVVLKKLNRMEKVRLVSAKEALTSEKQKVDSINLQFQNLLYEGHHLMSEASKCFQFKSKDEDIELIPVEEFLRDAPEEITKKFKKIKDEDDALQHELRLARLEWELNQRKNLSALCKSMEEQKKKLATDIVELKNRLEGLGPKLASVLEATKPLQEHLDLPVDKIRAEHKLASMLPNPLYLFYANVDAYKQVFDLCMNIVIVGDTEEVPQWKEAKDTLCNVEDDTEEEPEVDLDTQELEEAVEVKKRRHRKSVQADPKEEKKKKLLEVHPLAVQITVSLKDGVALTMKMRYYNQLNIITTTSSVRFPDKLTGPTAREVLLGENVLNELTEGDDGLESPNPGNNYLLKKLQMGPFRSLVPDIGFAYKWAQTVCGFDFLSKQISRKDADRLSQDSVETVMRTIKKRLETRHALALQLQQFEKNLLPELPQTLSIAKPHMASLSKWTSSTYQAFCQSGAVDELVEDEMICPTDLFYHGVITRSNVTMQVRVVLKHDYPLVAPIISITLNRGGKSFHSGNNDDMRDIERTVNTDLKQGSATASWLLGAQITYLCSILDVYLESTDPETFPQSTMFLRNVSSRNRKRPFRFKNIGSGIFVQ